MDRRCTSGCTKALRLALLAASIAVLSCDSGRVTAPPDHIVEGVNFSELFAPPRPEELEAVRSEWAARSFEATAVNLVTTAPVELSSLRFEARLYSHRIDGDLHDGAAVVPVAAPSGGLPVLLYTHFGQAGAFEEGLSVESALVLLALAGGLRDDVVYAFPSYRSQYIRLAGQTYRSGGRADPWDGQVDDALAFLEVVRQEVGEADAERVAGLGLSGGGAVALLAAIRDPEIAGVLGFFPPSDFLGPFVQDIFERALLGEESGLPGFAYLQSEVLGPLRRGDLSVSEVRLDLIRRSVTYFAKDLPRVQIHHGDSDEIVPVSQSQTLQEALRQEPHRPAWEVFLYPGGTHNPVSLPGSAERAAGFVAEVTGRRL